MRFWYSPNFLAICALIILSIPALKDLARDGFYTSHDGETHTARMAQYYGAAIDGQLPPRFAGTLYNGLGSPILTYIYPLPYLAGSLVHSLGFSFTDSFEIIMALGFIFSGIFAYLWLREVFKSDKAAFIGALFYIWVPYRFLLIYVRGSISENTAYTFLPLVFYCLTKLLSKNNRVWLAATALSMSLLMLSQNLVALLFLPIIGAYVLYLSILKRSPKFPAFVVLAGLWAFSIAAVTYLPAAFERKFVRFDEVYALTYLDHFVSAKQLIYSPWGYGFSLTGFDDLMSFQIGLAHLLILAIFPAVLILRAISRIEFFKKLSPFLTQVPSQNLPLTLGAILIIIITFILMIKTEATIFLWQHFEPLTRIDYPWRLLGITTWGVSLVAAYVAKAVKPGLFFIFLVAAVLIANRNHIRINLPATFDDNFFLNYTNTATQLGEFTPKWRQSTRVPIGFDLSIPVEVVSGDAAINNVAAISNEVTFAASVSSDSARVRINKFYFPGWTVQVDGIKLTPFKDLIITDTNTLLLDQEQDASGLMMVALEKGEHEISAHFGETPLRLFANYLSLGSFVLALGVIARYAKK